MKYFKSLWFSIKKSTGLPPNQVFIPMKEEIPITHIDIPKKITKPKEIKIIIKKAED